MILLNKRTLVFSISLWSLYVIGTTSVSKLHADLGLIDNVTLKKPALCSQNSENLTVLGECGLSNGNCYSVFVRDGIAYYGDGEMFTIADVNDPSNPAVLSTFPLTSSTISRIFISGDYAYVANHLGGIWILDVSSLSEPVEVWNCIGSAMDITISGNYAYVADYYGGLKILDVSKPSTPVEIGCYDDKISAMGVFVSGKYAYVSYCFYGLLVFDISDPSEPLEAGSYDTEGSAIGVSVSGDYSYVADRDRGLLIIDISVPYDPDETGFYTVGGASKVSVSGNYAYVANGEFGLRIVDVTDPFNPVESEYFEPGGFVQDVFVTGRYVYVADWEGGITILKHEISASCVSDENISNRSIDEFQLSQNYPNPFNSSTTITYRINSGNRITLSIYNVVGQMINILADETQSPGIYSVQWNGTDTKNIPVTSGIYWYRLQAGEYIKSHKMLLLK